MKSEFTTTSPEETIALGARLGKSLKGGEVIAYKGGLGAGKTTFTRGLAQGMGLPDEVHSPTFALVNEYHSDNCPLTLCHFDFYRINTAEGLESTGYYDYISPDTVICGEWSENLPNLLDETITVTIEGNGYVRNITIETDLELTINN